MPLNQINVYINNKFLGAIYNIDESIINISDNSFMLFWGDNVPHQAFCISNVKTEKKIDEKGITEYYLTKTI